LLTVSYKSLIIGRLYVDICRTTLKCQGVQQQVDPSVGVYFCDYVLLTFQWFIS